MIMFVSSTISNWVFPLPLRRYHRLLCFQKSCKVNKQNPDAPTRCIRSFFNFPVGRKLSKFPDGRNFCNISSWDAPRPPHEKFPSGRIDGVQDFSVDLKRPSFKISSDKQHVLLDDGNGEPVSFHSSWLRHNCHCSECKQPYSGQKAIVVSELKPSYTIASIRLDEHDVLRVDSNEEEHCSVFPLEFLKRNIYSESAVRRFADNCRPLSCPKDLPKLSYEDTTGEEGLAEWMHLINEYGICVVTDVPKVNGMVKKMAEMIWPVQRTIYGEVWDVKSDPQPINIAYSDAKLDYHMDLAYYESPPGVQFLHCLRFDESVEGGESLFVDAWQAAESLRSTYPDEFNVLTTVPAMFQKVHSDRDRPVHMKYQRPHIMVEPGGKNIIGVFWAPAFEGPLMVNEVVVADYYKAYHRFATLIENSTTKMEFRLVPGDLVGFNNRRYLHGRNEFRLNGGMRHLQGCYLNIDEFKSRLEVVSERSGKNRHIRHMLNQTWI